jgi:AcrR family transcriptional regulator
MELREKIIQAAEQVMRAKGLARTTTKEIARIAGCSEGSLYNHFQSKEDLFLQVLKGILPTFVAALMKLSQRQGIGTVQDNLEDAAIAALAYFHQSLPTSASIFSDPDLLAHHREGLHERNEGPHRANELVAAYLRSEQLQGRVRADVDPRAAADLLLGACFQHVFIRQFSAEDESKEAQAGYAKQVISTLMQGLLPGAE